MLDWAMSIEYVNTIIVISFTMTGDDSNGYPTQPGETHNPRTVLGAIGICIVCLFSIAWIVDISAFLSFGVLSTGGLLTWIAAILIAVLWKKSIVSDSAEAILLAFYAGYAIAFLWAVLTIMHFG